MPLFKAVVTYTTAANTRERVTCMLEAPNEAAAETRAENAISEQSRAGVRAFHGAEITRNATGVEWIGARPA